MKTLFFISALMLFSINLFSAPPDSCLKVYDYPYDSTFTNPESVMIDSCDGSPTYGVYFGKKYFTVMFNYNIIPRTYLAPPEAIIEYTIDSIDSKYSIAINEFTQLKLNYGNFKFREQVPNMPDTSLVLCRSLYLIFDKYVPIKEIEQVLNGFTSVKSGYFSSWFGAISDVNESNTDNDEIIIYPNPVSNIIMIQGIDSSDMQSYSIYDTYGKKIIEGEFNKQIDVSYLIPGVYFIKVGNKSYKFIKI